VVFDRESPNHPRCTQLPKATQLATTNGIKVAHSVPSFEFWLLLHFEFTTASCNDCDAVVKKLKKHIKNYDKVELPLEVLLSQISTAMKHAAQCHKHWQTASGDCNPSTQVDKLLQELNDSAPDADRLFRDL
jgi:exonuclease VII small subunit